MAGARHTAAHGQCKSKDNPLNPEMVTGLLKQSSKAEKLADEKIGDVDTYHYKVTLNAETLIDSIADFRQVYGAVAATLTTAQMAEAKKFLKDSALEVELWAGQARPAAPPDQGLTST